MEDILKEHEAPLRKRMGRKAKQVLALYVPVAIGLFLLLSPILLRMYRNNFDLGPVFIMLVIFFFIAAVIILVYLRALNWKTVLLLIAATIIVFIGILIIFTFMAGNVQKVLQFLSDRGYL